MALKSLVYSKSKDMINSCLDPDGYGSFTRMTTFGKITDIANNKDINNLQVPEFQAPLDEDKIEQMVKAFRKYESHFLSQILTIANIKFGKEEVNYIMDGQHRMEMIKQLHEKYQKDMHVLLAIHIIKTEEELKQLFDNLNKDSTKNAYYVKLPIFKKQLIDQFRSELKKRYIDCYSKTKKTSSHITTIADFTEDLEKYGFFSNNSNLTLLELCDKIDNDHNLFLKYIGYLEHVSTQTNQYFKDEENMIKNRKNVMFFKNNNFVEHVCLGEIPTHNFIKNSRTSITSTLRKKVWENQYGNKLCGFCPIIGCNHKLSLIDKYGFQCGHIVSKKNGGSDDLSNLRPICADCNSKMNSTNWDEFIDEQKLKYLESENNIFDLLFDEQSTKKMEDDPDDCENDIDCNRCSKSIKKENCHLIKFNGSYELVCKKCNMKNKNIDLKSNVNIISTLY